MRISRSRLRALPVLRPVAVAGSLVLLAGLVTAAPGAPAVAAPPAAVDHEGVGRTTTLAIGAAQLRPAADSSTRTAPLRTDAFSMVAVTWRGPDPHAEVRTLRDGRWGDWHHLHPLGDGPTPGSPEARGGPESASEPLWVGDAEGIQLRTARRSPQALDLVLIDPGDGPETRQPGVTASPASYVSASAPVRSATVRTARAKRPSAAPRPRLLKRGRWGADNSLRNGKPTYLKKLKQVHLHHTATTNDYSRKDVPRIIRGMYRYHTQTLGWFDIGYNFLVDRFGRAWVGRSGGHWRLVRGAHTLGFNHKSVGIALIGTNRGWQDARRKIAKLAAWKLDREGIDAARTVRITSRGSDRFPEGQRLRLPVIDGHRDTNQTACPGGRLYRRLPEVRRAAQVRIDRWN